MKEEWEVSILLTLFCLFLRGKPKSICLLYTSDAADEL